MDAFNVTTQILDLAEARRRLPRVRERVRKLRELAEASIAASAEIEDARRSGASTDALRRLADASAELQQAFVAEVRALNDDGAMLKDPVVGLIDFYAWRGEDLVFLCWKDGEDDVSHWHGLHEGFAGRKPTDDRT